MPTPTYVYPSSKEIMLLEQKLLPDLTGDDPIFTFFPQTTAEATLLEWEQLDNFKGTQNLRGYGGRPQLVNRVGSSRYRADSGVYGDFITLNEEELTKRRAMATYGGRPIPIRDMVAQAAEQLLVRRLNLIRKICWDLVVSGTFSVAHPETGVTYTGSYTPPSFTPSILWSYANRATAIPLYEMRGYRSYAVGQSCSFGGNATQYMNWQTARNLLANTNDGDLGGVLLGGGNTVNSLSNVNEILVMNDLPRIAIHDGGYIDEAGNWQYSIPAGKILVVGKRTTGAKIGEYRMTRNVNNPSAAPGAYTRVFDRGMTDVPASVEVHDGHNGGPLIQFPGSVIVVNAY